MGFELLEKDGLKFFKITEFEEAGANAVFTTRQYLFSDQFNLSYKWSNDKYKTDRNYRTLFDILNIDYRSVYYANQVHKDNIIIVEKGFDFFDKSNCNEADGLITSKTNLTLMTFHADCIPVYIFDKVKRVICLIHSGWRGTLMSITKKAIEILIKNYNCLPHNLMIGIGPGICEKHFEVGADVYQEFVNIFGSLIGFTDDKRYYIDLKCVIKNDVVQSGVPLENIVVCHECTFENDSLFFSYRRDREKIDRLGGMVALMRMVRT